MMHDPHESGPRTSPFAKNAAAETFFFTLNTILHNADLPSPETVGDVTRLPLVYIVGVPRSGTTLLAQMLCGYLPVGYINNLIARFWLKPSVGIRLSQAVLGEEARNHITLRSTHGTTEGASSPHEFGYFWRYWLQLDQTPTHHLSVPALAKLDRVGLQYALQQEILASFNCPVVLKNIICGFHAAFLTEIHPLSLFLYIQRDPLATAASILKVRRERFGSYHTWWSLKPSTYPFDIPPNDPALEVAMQVVMCQREIDQELSRPGVHSLRCTYEQLCTSPRQVLEQVCERLAALGSDICPVGYDLPSLTVAPVPGLPSALATRLRHCLAELC
jgi:hypothetical protein